MLYEDLRLIHEDNERLEQAIADRLVDEPKNLRRKLTRDHEIATFTSRIHEQSQRALRLYNKEKEEFTKEEQSISTGDVFEGFYKQVQNIKDYHKKYPNEPIENLERAYRMTDDARSTFAGDIDGMFTGEEALGRFFDLTMIYEEFINLPSIRHGKKRPYLKYLEIFDKFAGKEYPIKRHDKMTDAYFSYVHALAEYLESFMRRTRPLEDLDKLFTDIIDDFIKLWDEDKIDGWGKGGATQTNGSATNGVKTQGTGEGVWCADCEKEFANENVYKAHLTGKKHIKAAQARKENGAEKPASKPAVNGALPTGWRLKERAIAQREFQIVKLAEHMKNVREDTQKNVERKAGMTDRERQQELAALYAEDEPMTDAGNAEEEDQDGDEKVYNPLKLPLAWDGKPIPYWLYKLHGLGVEFSCEICGNYVYMGRRAFDKHFSEARHVHGLKCLGITSTSLFREITGIADALKLWEKIQSDKAKSAQASAGVEEMEDSEGNVMPRRVYDDLAKAGLL